MIARRAVLRVFQVLVSIGLLSYLVFTIPMRDVLATLNSTRVYWLLGGIMFVTLANVLGALQMRAILASQGMTFSVWQITGINLITNFYGLFLPGFLAGGAIRWYHLSTPEGKRAQALAAMIYGRGVEIVTMLGFGVVFWYLANSRITSGSLIAAMIVAFVLVAALVLLSVSQPPHALLRTALVRLPFAHLIRDRVLKVSACLVDIGRLGWAHQLRFLSLCALRNAFAVSAFICFARALSIGVPAVSLGWIRALVDLLLILPISIAGLGVRDASLVATLSPLGVPSAAALAFSFLLLAVSLSFALTGGIIEAWRVYRGVAPGLASTQHADTQ